MLMRHLVSLLAVIGLFSSPDSREGSDLQMRLQRVETAFKTGDASTLRRSCSTNGRVQIDMQGLTLGHGSYAAGQLEAIFRHIFEDVDTKDFAFPKEDVTVSPEGTAFARGRWDRRRRSGGPSRPDYLTFTLREESGEWRIQEIRSSH